MKSAFAGLAALFVLGLLLSIYLILSPDDYALMLLKGKKFTESENYYHNKYAEGNRSADIAIPLQTLSIAAGDNDEAIKVMQEYVNAHPLDIHARKLLGQLYLNSERRPEYLKNLEEIKKLNPDQEVLDELHGWYHALGQDDKDEKLLEEIQTKGFAKAQDYISLAYIYAGKGDMKKAYAELMKKSELFPKENNFDSVNFEIYLLYEIGREEGDAKKYDSEIFNLAYEFILKAKEEDILNLISSFKNLKREDLALRLIPVLEPLAKKNKRIEELIVSLEWDTGQKELARKRVMDLYNKNELTVQLIDLLLNMALENKEYGFVKELIERYNPALFSESTLLWIASISSNYHLPILSELVEARLGSNFLALHPVVHTAIELALNRSDAQEMLQQLIKKGNIGASQALALMQLALNNNYKPLVLKMSSLLSYNRMNVDDLTTWAQMYIQMQEAKQGLNILKSHEHEIGHEEFIFPLVLLQTSLGDTQFAQQWFKNEKNFKKDYLFALYSAAESAKAYPFALDIAISLFARFPSSDTEHTYALALLNAGDCKEALPILRRLRKTKGFSDINQSYLLALIACREENQVELRDFVSCLMESKLSASETKELAYLLMEKLHDYENATTLFFRLVHLKPVSIEDIETLLSLSGPRPLKEIVCFVIKLSRRAADKDKLKWVKALQAIGEYETAYHIFMSMPAIAWQKSDFLLWIELLTQLEYKEELKKALSFAFCYLNEEEDFLKILAQAASLSLISLQDEILNYLIYQNPQKALYWKKIAILAYEQGDFTKAFDYFNSYFACCGSDEDYAPYFFYAEMLLFRNDPLKAEAYYRAAFDMIARMPYIPSAARAMQAALCDRLKKKWVGANELSALYYENLDPDIRAAWANELIIMGHIKQARAVLYGTFDESYMTESTVCIEWKKNVDAQVCQTDNEILIKTTLPLSESNIAKVSENLPSGVVGLETGLRAFLIKTDRITDFKVTTEKDLIDETFSMRVRMRFYPKPLCLSYALKVARINLALRECDYTMAAKLLEPLIIEHPENIEVLNLISTLESTAGKWQAGMGWLAKAHQISRDNESVWTAFRDLYFPFSPFIAFEREAELTEGNSANQYYRWQSEWIFKRDSERIVYFEAEVERVRSHMAEGSVFNEEGIPEGFLGTRTRGEIRGRNVAIDGTETQCTVYVAEGLAGAGVRWLTRFDQGNFFVYADWNRPYWEINECLVHNGSISRSGIAGQYIYNYRLDSSLDLALHQYGANGARHATNTTCIGGTANWNLTLKDPWFTLSYILDAEYIFAIEDKVNPLGQIYQPVPLTSRENHTIRVVIKTLWRKWWTFGCFFGETFNRLGTHNPTAGVNLHYFYPCGVELDLSAERYPSTTTTGAQVNDLKGVLKWRF